MTEPTNDRLRRWTTLLVPASWRESVRQDLREDSHHGVFGQLRGALEIVGVAASLHWVVTGSAFVADVRYAIRSLAHARWFTLGALLTFAIGIGANAAVFAAVDRVLFRSLPFQDPDRLVSVQPYSFKTGQKYFMFPKAVAVSLRHDRNTVEDLAFAGMPLSAFNVEGPDGEPLRLTDVSYNLLDVLGVRPILGQGFARQDAIDRTRVAIIFHDTWRSRFAASPDVIGRRLADRAGPIEVRGVLPSGFIVPSLNWASRSDGLILSPDLLETAEPRDRVPAPIARLRPGSTVALVQHQVDAHLAATEADRPAAERTHVLVEPLQEGVFWNCRASLALLFLGGSLVWLVASVNLGTLMVARGRSREHEIAIRTALGASLGRILSSAAIESALLSIAGGAVALIVLMLTLRGLVAAVSTFVKPLMLTSLDGRIVAFVVLGTCAGSAIAALYPVWRAGRADPHRGLKRNSAAGRTPQVGGGRGLLVVESAIGTVLVLAGSLAIRSSVGLQMTDLGYDPDGLHSVFVRLPGATPSQTLQARADAQQRVLDAVRRLPMIASASGVNVPLFGGEANDLVQLRDGPRVAVRQIVDGYFGVMQTRVLAGRMFTDAEIRAHAPVAMMSRSAAAQMWPNVPPEQSVGRPVAVEGQPIRPLVGVVADTRARHSTALVPEMFVPASLDNARPLALLARARSGSAMDVASLRSSLQREFGQATTVRVTSVSSVLEPWLQNPRLYSRVFGAFAAVSLLLSAIGLFAITAFDVSLRRDEMGIRMMLGAGAGAIQRLVIRDAVRPVAIGVAIGMAVALWAARFFQSLLFQLDARDPWTYGLVTCVLLLTAVVAAARPAQRAASVDPAVILRTL